MTTTVKITNKAFSNGDVHVRASNTFSNGSSRVAPGASTEFGVTDSSVLTIFETMPASIDDKTKAALYYGERADELIAAEIAGQDKMWGIANERADSSNGELLAAGCSQSMALLNRRLNGSPIDYRDAPPIYPTGWSGFRDYGSDVANLVVAIAYFRQEVKRLIAAGADTTRLTRDQANQPYRYDQPAQPFPVDPSAPIAEAAPLYNDPDSVRDETSGPLYPSVPEGDYAPSGQDDPSNEEGA